MRKILLTILASTAIFSPVVAGAADKPTRCPTNPTIDECRTIDPDYACGKIHFADETSTCSVLLAEDFKLKMQSSSVKQTEAMLPDQPGVTVSAGAKKYTYEKHNVKGFTSDFHGIGQKSQLLGAGGYITTTGAGATIIGIDSLKKQRARWDASAGVDSCSEYVYERFHGNSKFKGPQGPTPPQQEAVRQPGLPPHPRADARASDVGCLRLGEANGFLRVARNRSPRVEVGEGLRVLVLGARFPV